MIVVRRSDTEPGGRFAGGRFAPSVSVAVTEQEPSPREMRERTYQRIQDEGYLRARRETNPAAVMARATAHAFDALAGELQPVLAGITPEGDDKTGSSLGGGITMSLERMALTGLDDALDQDGLSPAKGLISGHSGVEAPIEVAGLPLWLVRLLRQVVRKPPPAKPGASKPSVPRRPDHEKPAPVVPPKPDRPLSRIPDLGLDEPAPKPDGHQDEKSSEVQAPGADDIRRTIRERVAEKFRRTNQSKVEISLEEIGLFQLPQQAIHEFARLLRGGDFSDGSPTDFKVQLNLTEVSPDLVREIERRTGKDVSGYRHSIDTQNLKHAFGGHDENNEKRSDQIPINDETVSRFLEIVSDPENIHEIKLRKDNSLSITFRKRLNGHYYFVEQLGTRRRTFAFKTHYIKVVEPNL